LKLETKTSVYISIAPGDKCLNFDDHCRIPVQKVADKTKCILVVQ